MGVLVFHLNKIDPPTVVVHTGAILQQDSVINTHTCTHRVSTHEVTCGINVTMRRLTSSHSLSRRQGKEGKRKGDGKEGKRKGDGKEITS